MIPGSSGSSGVGTPTLGVRDCSKCGERKPLTEFYERVKGSGDRLPYCRDCDNAKPRKRNQAKIVRIRARHRAVAELIKRHDAEFRDLLEYFTATASEEAEQLAESAAQKHAHTQDETARLRPGKGRPGQSVTERIDVSRCPHCVKAHDRGHACPKCGAVPQKALYRPDDGVLDEIAIERRLAGEPIALSTAELREAARQLAARGCTATTIAKRLGMSGASVNQALAKDGAA